MSPAYGQASLRNTASRYQWIPLAEIPPAQETVGVCTAGICDPWWGTPEGSDRPLCLQVGDAGAEALAALRDAPALRTLALTLWYNHIGDYGAKALAALKAAPALESLVLDLSANTIGAAGAEALAELEEAPRLTALSLTLWYNHVGDIGAAALAALKVCTPWPDQRSALLRMSGCLPRDTPPQQTPPVCWVNNIPSVMSPPLPAPPPRWLF